MKPSEVYAFDGVFPAVKCEICDTIYPAGSEDYVAFQGSVTVGLDKTVIAVPSPRKPLKRSMRIVCRTPSCTITLVRRMLDVDGAGNDELWFAVLREWVAAGGFDFDLRDPAPPEKKPLTKKRPR